MQTVESTLMVSDAQRASLLAAVRRSQYAVAGRGEGAMCDLCGKQLGTGFLKVTCHPGSHLFRIIPCPQCDEYRTLMKENTI